ncbi:MAG: transcription termination factor NusA [Synergistetes bacterium]|nr:transcription termination factor NusA [Synergistota bacterium]MCX8128193.1 transcription termination factor NusA [Synergistota bacterium]MDW8192569.1 transcription termination factor NusA [Synergistota bacterium]
MGKELIRVIKQIEKEKGISKNILFDMLKAALVSAYKKHFGSSHNIEIDIDPTDGEIKVFALKRVVKEVKDPRLEISIDEAVEHGESPIEGSVVRIEVTPHDFGRIAAQTAKQVIVQRLKEVEREVVYEEFRGKVGDIVTGTIYRKDKAQVMINLGKTEAILPLQEQIPTEEYDPGRAFKFYVLEVRKTTKGPKIVVSRTHPGLLKRLFELEIPEVHDGVVDIKAVVREPGARSKVAVWSNDPNVDPIGACVGAKGARVQAISRELSGERIDIVVWSSDPLIFIANALSPAKVIKIERIEGEEKGARIWVPPEQLSLAIGREGQNARLVARLTGWRIDIKPFEEELKVYEG